MRRNAVCLVIVRSGSIPICNVGEGTRGGACLLPLAHWVQGKPFGGLGTTAAFFHARVDFGGGAELTLILRVSLRDTGTRL